MLTLFVIGMTCLMAVQGEPEAEADPQFFYPNTYPVYNQYYPRATYPSIYPQYQSPFLRTPVVQKAPVVQTAPVVRTPASTTSLFPSYPSYPAYPTYQPAAYYPPTFRYTPLSYYPSYPRFVQQTLPAVEKDVEESEEVIQTRDSMANAKPLRPIIPLFDYVRNANSQVTFLRPDQAPANEIPETGENDKFLIQFRSLPYTQAHLNRVPAANFGK